ncbi:MAG: hypothetical protein GVY13_12065 [Alphaproteobacteria bacterium]|jgi:uncharacterized protein (TIGR02186 family)|nr:hypothetical protein [Alphaproteobacteria bacterium]
MIRGGGWCFGSVLLAALLLLAAPASRAQELVADLSNHLIAISTAFTGTDVVLFGAVAAEGDIAVVVRGPGQDVVVRRMVERAGIWINGPSVTFSGVPSFYRVFSSRPMAEIATPAALEREGVGLEHLRLLPREPEGLSQARTVEFRAALIRQMQDADLYGRETGSVAVLGGRLFRADVHFPANVPTGQYIVSVLLFREGEVVEAQTTPLVVSKIGVSAEIFTFAHHQSAVYGILALVMAVSAGWIAGLVFRRG